MTSKLLKLSKCNDSLQNMCVKVLFFQVIHIMKYTVHDVHMACSIYTIPTCSISSNRKFGDEGTRHLAAGLRNNKHVTLLKYATCNVILYI